MNPKSGVLSRAVRVWTGKNVPSISTAMVKYRPYPYKTAIAPSPPLSNLPVEMTHIICPNYTARNVSTRRPPSPDGRLSGTASPPVSCKHPRPAPIPTTKKRFQRYVNSGVKVVDRERTGQGLTLLLTFLLVSPRVVQSHLRKRAEAGRGDDMMIIKM